MHSMRRFVTWIICCILLTVAWGLGTQIYAALSFPTHLRLLPGQEYIFDLGPLLRARTDNPDWVTDLGRDGVAVKIGRASCRERVCGAEGAVSFMKENRAVGCGRSRSGE